MHRRTFLATAAALALPLPALATPVLQYRAGLVDELLAQGDTVFVDFYASWCTTCAAQHRVIDALKAENPAYAAAISFVQVDWDLYRDEDLATRLAIPRRSTLVVLKGDQELGRLVAATGRAQIEELLNTALTAATA